MTPLATVELGAMSWTLSTPATFAALVLLPLFAMVMWRASQRLQLASQWRRGLVLGLHGLLYLACLLILVPPSYQRDVGTTVTLVTEGAGPSGAGAHVYAYGSKGGRGEGDTARLTTPGQLLLREPDLAELEILGHGLSTAQWQQLPDSLSLSWQPPELRGLVDVDWPGRVATGESFVVTGTLTWPEAGALLELRLVDPAAVVVASQTLAPGEHFALAAIPLAPGPVTYRLQLFDQQSLFSDDPVSVDVSEAVLARIHVAQSAPSFETRQFANWASDNGAALLIETRISADRDLVQRVNLGVDAPAGLHPDALARADLLLMDGRRWVELFPSVRTRVLEAVADGLGLLLSIDAALVEWLPAGEPVLGINVAPDSDSRLRWLAGQRSDEQPPLPVAPWGITSTTAQSLTLSAKGEVLESWQAYGAGRIAVSRIAERHRWLTGGYRSLYTRYWARLIADLGRPAVGARWHPPATMTTLRPYARSEFCANLPAGAQLSMKFIPMPTTVQGSGDTDLEGDGIETLALTPHASGASEACGFVWPAVSGWHQLGLFNSQGEEIDRLWVWVLEENAFAVDRVARRQQATRQRVWMAAATGSTAPQSRPQRMPRGWIWMLLVAALLPLWIERRLSELA